MARRISPSKHNRYFRDLRDFISLLEETGNLHRINARIEKNSEWMPLGLPPLQPKMPWFGYSLGHWSQENEENAELAVRGDCRKVAERLQQKASRS